MNERPSILSHLILFCLRQRLMVILLAMMMITWGVIVAPFDWELPGIPRDPVPVDAIPDIGENQQIVFTEWMGRSPQDIDDQISYPLTVSLLGIPGIKSVRSQSVLGFSMIYVIFDEEVDFYWSRSRIIEKLNSLPAGTLPEGVTASLGPDATALGQVFWYTLEGRDPNGNPTGGWDLHELRSVQDWTVRYALLGAKGVAEVASIGGFVQEYQIDVDPDAMRAYGVSLDQVFSAVRSSNIDVGARTIEINKAEYLVRGLGFIENIEDIELVAIVEHEDAPVLIRDVAHVALGPALRRGALDNAGAEAVGGVVVVRYGDNPLKAIQNVKKKIQEIAPGLPSKILPDGTESRVTIIPFYDRSGLINETLETLNTALTEEVLVTIIVVVLMLLHMRSSVLISGMLPLAVLMTFVGMKVFRVDANIVALSGIAIAVGTIVDMGIVLTENILKRLEEAGPDENPLHVIHRASSELGSAVLTAVLTTVVSFLPVFTMEAAEGKLFRPLAYTKTFALIASIIIALTLLPAVASLLFAFDFARVRRLLLMILLGLGAALIALGVNSGLLAMWFDQGEQSVRGVGFLLMCAGGVTAVLAGVHLLRAVLPTVLWKAGYFAMNIAAAGFVTVYLARRWEPLGPELGESRNLLFVGGLVVGLLLSFILFRLCFASILSWCLRHKLVFLIAPTVLLTAGMSVWMGIAVVVPVALFLALSILVFVALSRLVMFIGARVGMREMPAGWVYLTLPVILGGLGAAAWFAFPQSFGWSTTAYRAARLDPDTIKPTSFWTKAIHAMPGLGKEFMPALDEGSFLYMPSTMPHASIGEALDSLQKMDMAIAAIPEVEEVVGKIGRAETPLDPAPIAMVEAIVNYRPEYILDDAGDRATFRFDLDLDEYARDEAGLLIPDPEGRPFRQWRDHITSPQDIWDEIVKVAQIPGMTSAPKLQPIETRIIMLQSGFRAPMGIKVYGPDLDTIEAFGLELERLLREIPSVEPSAVFADRIVGKPYLEIDIDRERIARYGISIRKVQDVIEVAIGGKRLTTTVQGRERYPVRVRYLRELRDQIESFDEILVPTPDGRQIPLGELSTVNYVRGPQMIKSEDTFLVGYVLFDKQPGYAEVDVVEAAQDYLLAKIASGELIVPAGISYKFAGAYENQVRASKRLALVLPLSLVVIFLILYLQFRSTLTTLIVFSGVFLAWSGGFLMIWLYGQSWFLDFHFLGANMREVFQVRPVNLSVAVWVGFLALFGIATDNGVVLATLLQQSFRDSTPSSIDEIRAATLVAGRRRVRACLMTTATTVLALLPVLTSTGRGSDIMIPMAIPSFGGMIGALLTLLVVPVLFCAVHEWRHRMTTPNTLQVSGEHK